MKQEVKEAKGPVWKKVLWWTLGVLALIGAIIGIVCILKRKGPLDSASEIIKDTQHKIDVVDLNAKIAKAEIVKEQDNVIQELETIKKIDDKQKRLDRLAAMMTE